MMRTTTAALACLSLTLACTAEIDGPASPSGSAGLGTGGLPAGQPPGLGPTGMAGSPVSSPATCSNAATDVDLTPLRRLTNAEYLNTVSDLLGDVSALNLDFAA